MCFSICDGSNQRRESGFRQCASMVPTIGRNILHGNEYPRDFTDLTVSHHPVAELLNHPSAASGCSSETSF